MYELVVLVLIGTLDLGGVRRAAAHGGRSPASRCGSRRFRGTSWSGARRGDWGHRRRRRRWEPDPRNPETLERWREGTRWTRTIRKRERE